MRRDWEDYRSRRPISPAKDRKGPAHFRRWRHLSGDATKVWFDMFLVFNLAWASPRMTVKQVLERGIRGLTTHDTGGRDDVRTNAKEAQD